MSAAPAATVTAFAAAGGRHCRWLRLWRCARRRPSQATRRHMKLHWKTTTTTTIQLAVTATGGAATGWFGIGFARDLKMYPADAVIGNQAGSPVPVDTYNISSYSAVRLTSAFTIGSKTFAASGTTATMTFTRTTGDGGVAPVQVAGSNKIIWAYSSSGSTTIAKHNYECWNDHRRLLLQWLPLISAPSFAFASAPAFSAPSFASASP
ncbi:unnamed protein product [Closterium sp. NIES-64]|nr:unnamed protein product [Closterium sp. NIES-64]